MCCCAQTPFQGDGPGNHDGCGPVFPAVAEIHDPLPDQLLSLAWKGALLSVGEVCRPETGRRFGRKAEACKRRGGDGCMTPSEQNAAARAWADTDPAGAQQAICSAGSLRALRRAYVALRREQPDAGRRRVREVIRVIRFAIRGRGPPARGPPRRARPGAARAQAAPLHEPERRSESRTAGIPDTSFAFWRLSGIVRRYSNAPQMSGQYFRWSSSSLPTCQLGISQYDSPTCAEPTSGASASPS